jgi:hypothetical protein
MTDCPRCREMIIGQPITRNEEVGHTVRADGKRDTHFSKVSICGSCHRLEKRAEWEVMARNAVFLIIGALALYWFLFENIEAQSQKTVAVTAVAPKATAPRLIPPGDRGAR